MTSDFSWAPLELDVRFGYLGKDVVAPRQHHPQVVVNDEGHSVLRIIREELRVCRAFSFSVAFVSPRAIALLKQELVDFTGTGRVVTSDYLRFNSPAAFAELLNLQRLGIDVRIHNAQAFHPKGYIFEHDAGVTAMLGSSNLTENALVKNHEWNLKVSAASDSDLSAQLAGLVQRQIADSAPITQEWIDSYAENYLAPAPREGRDVPDAPGATPHRAIVPNAMQRDALLAIDLVRSTGETRALLISATGTGKTILSALDVKAFAPRRFLFVVHREQILDKTIREYQRVLGGPPGEFGKLTGNVKQPDRRYVFATIQTLSQPAVLESFSPYDFDYVVVDEAHRAGAESYQRLLGRFEPRFLLGMTATPERTDGFDVFDLFAHNVPYEIRLNHALEEDMLSPFHYYGVADVTYADGTTTSDESDLAVLISTERVAHLVRALETYGQAGVAPRGLIFCSRKEEAHALSDELNQRRLRGHPLRTVALTGDDPVSYRETKVAELEGGELDYILTVDIFNEGVDIPTVNQVVMLRQTQSAIIFVQQLGRGLRKATGKEYLVVIDFIGNYANNYMIPIALFGDESLNKESLRKNLIAAEESGVLPGLSSVRFDKIAQDRVLRSITDTALDSMPRLKTAIQAMRYRVGGVPKLWDFLRFESVDPVLLATKSDHYPALIEKVLRIPSGLTPSDDRALRLLSHEVLPAKRPHEFVLLRLLLDSGSVTPAAVEEAFVDAGIPDSTRHVESAIDTLTLEKHAEADLNRYREGIVTRDLTHVTLRPDVLASYRDSTPFREAVDDLIQTGMQLVHDRYAVASPFTPGCQYSRKDVTRLLCWPRKWTSTLYGYKVDRATVTCPIFVTLHKSESVAASTAYEDRLIDETTMLWYTRSRRNLQSLEVRAIVDGDVQLEVFVKKDDAEGTDFYYLGSAQAHDAEQTTMPDAAGQPLDVVRMHLRFDQPIDTAMYDYFHPLVTL